MSENLSDLDRPLWGATNIAVAAGLFDEDGEPDIVRAYYLLSRGFLPATKLGRAWVTTARRLRSVASGEFKAKENA